jgi:predicted metalloprotease
MRHSDIISCADLKTGKVKQLDRLSERCMAILVDDKTIVNSKADTWLEKNYLSGVYNNTLIFGNTAYNGAHILVAVQNEKIVGSIVFENNRIKVLNAKDKVVSDYDDEDYWSYGFPTYSRKLPF